jgi:hypothetical protein
MAYSRAARGADLQVVTGNLSLQIDLARDPSHGQMKDKKRFHNSLTDRKVVVHPSQVSCFVYPIGFVN